MFGIGGQELFFILILALLVLGPSKLPEIAKTLGKVMGEFQRATNDLKREIDLAAEEKPKKPATDTQEATGEDKQPEPEQSEAQEETAAEQAADLAGTDSPHPEENKG